MWDVRRLLILLFHPVVPPGEGICSHLETVSVRGSLIPPIDPRRLRQGIPYGWKPPPTDTAVRHSYITTAFLTPALVPGTPPARHFPRIGSLTVGRERPVTDIPAVGSRSTSVRVFPVHRDRAQPISPRFRSCKNRRPLARPPGAPNNRTLALQS